MTATRPSGAADEPIAEVDEPRPPRWWRPEVQLPGLGMVAAAAGLGFVVRNPAKPSATDLGILQALIEWRGGGEAFYRFVEFWNGPQGVPWLIVGVSVVIALVGHRALGVVFGVLTGLAWTPGHYAKAWFPRDRPPAAAQPLWEVTGANSYVSGHTGLMVAAAVAAFLVASMLGLRRGRWWVLAACLAWAVVVGYTRMAAGIHFPTDVLGGALLDGGTALMLYPLAARAAFHLGRTRLLRDRRR